MNDDAVLRRALPLGRGLGRWRDRAKAKTTVTDINKSHHKANNFYQNKCMLAGDVDRW